MSTQHGIAHDKQGFLLGTAISLRSERHIANIDAGIQEVKHAIQRLSRAVLHAPIRPHRLNRPVQVNRASRPSHSPRLTSLPDNKPSVTAIKARREPHARTRTPSSPPAQATQATQAARRLPQSSQQAITPVRQSQTTAYPAADNKERNAGIIKPMPPVQPAHPLRDASGRFTKGTQPHGVQSRPRKAVMPYGVSDAQHLRRAMAQQTHSHQAAHKGLLGFLKSKQRKDQQAHDKTDGILGKLLAKPVALLKSGAGRAASAGFNVMDDVAGGGLSLAGSLGKGAFRLFKRVPVLGKVLALGGLALTARAALGHEAEDDPTAPDQKQALAKGAGGFVGGSLGAWGGAAAGAAVGSVVPVVGTAIGGIAGAIVGAMGGERIGEDLGQWLYRKDWKTGWDNLRRNMSDTSQSAWQGFSSLWPNTAHNLESTFDNIKTTFLSGADQLFSRIGAWYEQSKQWAQANVTQPFKDGLNGTANPQTGVVAAVSGAMGSGARRAGDWLQSQNPFSDKGLKLKAGANAGGATENGVTAMAHAVDDHFGGDVLRHAALNDRYHHGNIGYHSLHTDGLGFDTTFKAANDMQAKGLRNGQNTAAAQRYAEIKQYVESMGFSVGGKGSDIELIDEYNKASKKATGGHIHFAFRNKAAAKRYEDMVRGGAGGPTPEPQASLLQRMAQPLASARDFIRAQFGLNPKHSADANANVKTQGAKRADAALDFRGGVVNGLSDAQTRALMASKQETEANFRAGTVNRSGYVGLYQFGAAALEDIGLLKRGASKGGNAAMNNAANWTLAGGKTAFLNDKALQDQMAVKYANILLQRGVGAGALNATSSAEAKAGYIKAAWLKGNGGANDWVLRGKDSKDGMGTRASKYYTDGVNAVKFDAPVLQAASVPSVRYDVPKAQGAQSVLGASTKLNRDKPKTRTEYPTVVAAQEVSDRGLAHIASGGMGRGFAVP